MTILPFNFLPGHKEGLSPYDKNQIVRFLLYWAGQEIEERFLVEHYSIRLFLTQVLRNSFLTYVCIASIEVHRGKKDPVNDSDDEES